MSITSDRAPRWLWGLLLLYFGAQLAVRLWVSDALELDEAEQVLWTQQLALGYGTQPPLYTWLQWLVFQATGVSLFGLALLKNLLLASVYVFVYRAARTVLAWPWAATAAAAMLLLPQLGWEAQRDLTHSVLCTSAAAALLWLLFELLRRPRPALYLGLGAAFAVGTLGKYSFALYAAVMAAALAGSASTRPLLINRWMLAAAALALALLAPHAVWAAAHAASVGGSALAQLRGASTGADGPIAAFRGLTSLLRSLLGFAALPTLVLALACRRRGGMPTPDSPQRAAAAALLMRYLALLAFALALLALSGAASFKARWLLPLLFMLPLAFVLALPAFATAPRCAALVGAIALTAALVLIGLGLRPALDAQRGRPDELNLPAAALVSALREAGWHGSGEVRADRATLAATLLLHGAARSAARHPDGRAADGTPTLWIAAGEEGPAWHAWRGAAAPRCGPARAIELPYRHARSGSPPWRWTFCIAPPP